jgi:hypothetical protein
MAPRHSGQRSSLEQGAAKDQPFVAYVEHLAANGYVPLNGKA